jgi:hypothetical protein
MYSILIFCIKTLLCKIMKNPIFTESVKLYYFLHSDARTAERYTYFTVSWVAEWIIWFDRHGIQRMCILRTMNSTYLKQNKAKQTKTKIHVTMKVQETQFLYAILHLTECNLHYKELGWGGGRERTLHNFHIFKSVGHSSESMW